jgi:hypothetical protein
MCEPAPEGRPVSMAEIVVLSPAEREFANSITWYCQPDWATHVFTAGGTVLNAVGCEPVLYFVALRPAAAR